MRTLKQSTAANVMVFMTDSADHVSGKTGLTLTITASKDGAEFASISPSVTERGSGWYSLALTTAHTDTLGDLALHVTSTGADPSDLVCRVIAVDLADTVRLGLTALPNAAAAASGGLFTRGTGAGQINQSANGQIDVNVERLGNTAQSLTDLKDFADTGYDPAAHKVAGVVTVDTATAVTTVNGLAANVITATSIASDAITDAKVASDVTIASVTGAVGSVTGNVGGNVVGTVASVVGAVGSVTGNVGGNVTGSVGSVAAGGISASSFATNAIDSDAIAASAVSEIQAGLSTHSAADVWAVATRTLTAGTNIVLAKGTGVTGFNDLDAAGVATAVWNAATATYGSAGSYGLLVETNLDAAVSSASGATAQEVWEYATRTLTAFGFTVTTTDTANVTAIKAKTDNLPTDPADASDIAASFASLASTLATIAGYIDTEVAAIKAKTDNLPASPAAVGSAMALTSGERDSIAGVFLASAVPASYLAGSVGYNLGLLPGIKTKTDLITGTSITIAPLVSEDGVVTLVGGDTYSVAAGQIFEWTSDDWPDITLVGTTVTFSWVRGTASGTLSATVISATEVNLLMTAVQSEAIGVGVGLYKLVASGSFGVRTLAHGQMIVSDQYGRTAVDA